MLFVNPYAGSNQDIPNIGLAYLATHFKTRVIDLNTKAHPGNRYLNSASDILGISVQSRTYSQAWMIARQYKVTYPHSQVKSVSGALDVQCCYPYLDFADKISYSEPFSDNYPFPDYELFDSFAVFKKNWQKGKWAYALVTSLGCPFSCSYCMSRQRPYQKRSVDNCCAELKSAQEKWGIKSFVAVDDCFNVEIDRVIQFCEMIAPLKLDWACSNGLRADRFNEPMARALAASGCKNISFGIESTDNLVLETVKKGETIEQIKQAVDIAKKYFKKVGGFFIIGLPASSYAKDFNSLNWAISQRINAHFSYYLPFDQRMYYDAVFYGRGARPISAAYSHSLQKRLYRQTAFMRGSIESVPDFLEYVLTKLNYLRG